MDMTKGATQQESQVSGHETSSTTGFSEAQEVTPIGTSDARHEDPMSDNEPAETSRAQTVTDESIDSLQQPRNHSELTSPRSELRDGGELANHIEPFTLEETHGQQEVMEDSEHHTLDTSQNQQEAAEDAEPFGPGESPEQEKLTEDAEPVAFEEAQDQE